MTDASGTSTHDVAERATYLLAGLAWQESLLQAYRNYLLITQSIFLAVNVGLLSAQASADSIVQKLIFFLPGLCVSVIGVQTLNLLAKAVSERSKSVDWRQKRLLRFEKREDSTRHFATFRLSKEREFEEPEIEARQLTENQIESLLRPGPPKARQAFGIFVPGFRSLWFVITTCAAVNLLSLWVPHF